MPITPPQPPADIVALARERAAARAARDWSRADALKAEIEAAGWRVIDSGTAFHLAPAVPPSVEADGRTRYGHAEAVPSLLADPADARFSVHLVAEDRPDDLSRVLAQLRIHAPAGTQVVIVANDPSPDQAAVLGPGSRDFDPIAGRAPEVTWTSTPLGSAAARNVGLRRASGEIVVLADPSIELTGDALAPLEVVLEDPRVAVAGAFGLVTADFRHFSDAPGPAVDVIGGEWLAFRRDDYRRLGPLDEQFLSPRSLDAWWSLVLRAGPDPAAPPREARRLDLPLLRSADAPSLASTDLGTDRLAKRNYYRLLDRFREQAGDLLLTPRAPRA